MLLRTEQIAYRDEFGTSDRLVNQLCNVRRGYCGESGMEEKKMDSSEFIDPGCGHSTPSS